MGTRFLCLIRRFTPQRFHLYRFPHQPLLPIPRIPLVELNPNPLPCWWIGSRCLSYGSVNLVVSDGKPRFEINEIDQPVKEKYRKKKRFKLQRKREKRKRKMANRTDPRRIRPMGKKKRDRFPTAADRIKFKIEKAKMKEAILVEKLKRYEVPKVQGPEVEPQVLTGEERFYLKKMGQKRSNYVPVGRRGVFGGLILNMHLHWKKHETVKVICKPCKPGQIHEYTRDIARLSGGIPIKTVGNDTVIFYRGKNYVQPEVMSPVDTLSKKKALEKSKYEQSLETVRRFIAISEKELELYYRHVALYGDPNTRNADMVYGDGRRTPKKLVTDSSTPVEGHVPSDSKDTLADAVEESLDITDDNMSTDLSDEGTDWTTDDDSSIDHSDEDDSSCDETLDEADIESEDELTDYEEGLKDEKAV